MTPTHVKVLNSKMKQILIGALSFLCISVNAQNLVPNSGFENHTACPDSTGQLNLVKDWWAPWGKPVYFHACNNYQTAYRRVVPPGQKSYNVNPVVAHSGEAYVGIYVSVIWRKTHHDYLMCKLSSPLEKDSIYKVEMMVRLGDLWKFVDYLGMYFSNDRYPVSRNQRFNYDTPYTRTYGYKNVRRISLTFDKDTVRLLNPNRKLNSRDEWIKIEGEYKARGGEQYVTIGNFSIGDQGLFDNNIKPVQDTYIENGNSYLKGGFFYGEFSNSFYYIDDVYVGKLPAKESKAYRQFASTIKEGEKIKLEDVYFDTGQSTLKTKSYASLQLLLTYMQENKTCFLCIEGHTDNVGTLEDNLRLSEQRARAIISYLLIKGIESTRMEAIGYGSSKPVADNLTKEGREKNRRVEFTLINK